MYKKFFIFTLFFCFSASTLSAKDDIDDFFKKIDTNEYPSFKEKWSSSRKKKIKKEAKKQTKEYMNEEVSHVFELQDGELKLVYSSHEKGYKEGAKKFYQTGYKDGYFDATEDLSWYSMGNNVLKMGADYKYAAGVATGVVGSAVLIAVSRGELGPADLVNWFGPMISKWKS